MATSEELRQHFGLKTIHSLLKYVKNHIDEINRDGEHAIIQKGTWVFDDIAIKRLEELRGFGISAGIVNKVTDERLQERDQIIANLQTRLLAEATGRADAMEKLAHATEKNAQLEREMRLISEDTSKEKSDKAVLIKELEYLKAEKEQLLADKNRLEKQLEKKDTELTEERNRHWWKIWKK